MQRSKLRSTGSGFDPHRKTPARCDHVAPSLLGYSPRTHPAEQAPLHGLRIRSASKDAGSPRSSDRLERPEQTYRRKRDDDLVLSQPGIGIGARGVRVAPGLLAGERILLTFSKLVEPVAAIEHFDRLPIPYRAVAADINTGEAVIIERGDLALAMRASMSIPGAFPPVAMDGRVLVDGGVAQNLPVAAVRAMGADIVIAVNVGTPLATLDADASMLKVADQLVGLLTVGNTRQTIASLGERDILIEPPLG
ncbi:MAG: patatin-like phospholipase family protein, partial [Rhodanobacteraceae bacterium]|nr:patatin-like phospholipase family protein [Rhodanobacteraceae bacterium]